MPIVVGLIFLFSQTKQVSDRMGLPSGRRFILTNKLLVKEPRIPQESGTVTDLDMRGRSVTIISGFVNDYISLPCFSSKERSRLRKSEAFRPVHPVRFQTTDRPGRYHNEPECREGSPRHEILPILQMPF